MKISWCFSSSPLITTKYEIKGNDGIEIISKNKIKCPALKKNDTMVTIVTAWDIVDAFRICTVDINLHVLYIGIKI